MSLVDLLDQVEKLEDYKEAELALLSIKRQDSQLAKELSLNILKDKKGDIYFQSCAFEVLYAVDRSEAFSYVEKHVTSVEVELLNAMMESVTEDSEMVKEEPRLLGIAKLINNQLSALNKEELAKIARSVDWFKDSFKL